MVKMYAQHHWWHYHVYFKRYDTYHVTHKAIFNMYQRYILSGLDQKNLIYPQISQEFGNFNDQNIQNVSKNVSLKYCVSKKNDTICIV